MPEVGTKNMDVSEIEKLEFKCQREEGWIPNQWSVLESNDPDIYVRLKAYPDFYHDIWP